MSADTQLLGERGLLFPASMRHGVSVESGEPTGGWDYPAVSQLARGVSGFVRLSGKPEMQPTVIYVSHPNDWVKLDELSEKDTFSISAPSFETRVGTGGRIWGSIRSELLLRHDVVSAPTASAATAEEMPLLLDIPGALQEVRSQAGLPVQDLAAMFGIKRRQFYNLVSGEDTPDPARERRIARVTDAVSQLAELLGGNNRKVRAALLARLGGDSVYESSVADDPQRLESAVERALTASADGARMPRRSAPSSRATPEEAAAVRDFLRATRDDSGAGRDA